MKAAFWCVCLIGFVKGVFSWEESGLFVFKNCRVGLLAYNAPPQIPVPFGFPLNQSVLLGSGESVLARSGCGALSYAVICYTC